MTAIKKRWVYQENNEFSTELVNVCNSKIVAQLLSNRGITDPEEAKEFLNISKEQLSSPYEFEDMPKVVERVKQAVEKQEHIVVYGDFDADGITGTSILYKALKYIGANVTFYVPERIGEGHGMNTASILKLISARQAKLIITTDCGVSNFQEISLAKNFKVDVIITDHHELPEVLPQAYAVINPKMLLPSSKMASLCGAGVAYKVAHALLECFNQFEKLDSLLHLAAIGTIADLVPLKFENRVLTHLGLKAIVRNQPIALVEIAKSASIKLDDTISSETVAFTIAPRLNAIGRLDNASVAVELLTTEDPKVVENLVKNIEHINRKRQQLCDETFQQAVFMLRNVDLNKEKAIVLADKNWHPGVIGIVASKLVETYYKPTFLMSLKGNEARGSARSIEGVHLYNVLTTIKDLFTQYGGHELAAGFNLEVNKVNLFKKRVVDTVNSHLQDIIPMPSVKIEMDLKLEDLSIDLINNINALAPFGMNNPAPILSSTDVKILHHKAIGSDNNHLKLSLKTETTPIEALWWQHSDLPFDRAQLANIAFSPEINNFRDNSTLQLIIKDMVPSKESDSTELINKSKIKWIDHRKKTDITKLFNNYLKTNEANIAVYAESKHFVDKVTIDTQIVNRLCDNNYNQLILFEYPPNSHVFKQLITNIKPKIVHLSLSNDYKPLNEVEMIKFVRGMIKYACSNMNGEADITNMAVKLGTSNDVISCAIDVLVAANLIQIMSLRGSVVKFRQQDPVNVDLSTIPEVKKLIAEINAVYEYKKKLLNVPIEQFYKI